MVHRLKSNLLHKNLLLTCSTLSKTWHSSLHSRMSGTPGWFRSFLQCPKRQSISRCVATMMPNLHPITCRHQLMCRPCSHASALTTRTLPSSRKPCPSAEHGSSWAKGAPWCVLGVWKRTHCTHVLMTLLFLCVGTQPPHARLYRRQWAHVKWAGGHLDRPSRIHHQSWHKRS